MKCVVCGRAQLSLDEDGICPQCSEDKEFLDSICGPGSRSSLTNMEFEALISELNDLVNK
jgi:hypothetical protein